MLIAALVIAPLSFLFLTFGLGYVSDHTPYFHGVNIASATVAALGIYGLFVLGLALSRCSENQSMGRLMGDAAKLIGGALAIIMILFVALAAGGAFRK